MKKIKYLIYHIGTNKVYLFLYIKTVVFLILLLEINVNIEQRKLKYNKFINNYKFDYYFSKYICSFFILKLDSNCINDIFINNNFYDFLKDINDNINLTLKIHKKTKIENVILLIGIMPFIKKKTIIKYKIRNKEIYNFFKIHTNIKIKKNKIIHLTNSDFHYFNEYFNDLINFKWEFIPNHYIINHLRYIINNYYDKASLIIFDQILNLNCEFLINNNFYRLPFENINDLMSKCKNI